MQVIWTGTEAVARYMARLQEATRGQFAANVVLAGAMPIVNQAKLNLHTTASKSIARAGESISETGNLARSVHASGGHGLEGPTTGTDIGGLVITPTRATCLIGTNVAYARRVEFGFIGADSLGRNYHQAANPWLRPAFTEKRHEARKEMAVAARLQLQAIR